MNESDVILWCRRLWERRLVCGNSGNVSIALDNGDLLVTPSQKSLGFLEPGDLVCVDREGRPRNPAQRPTSELPLHLAAYRVRTDIRSVIHTHPTMSVVYSKTGKLFPRDTVGASESLGTCAWTPYAKNGTTKLAEICAAEFAAGIDLVVMERHGLTAIASSLEIAFIQSDLAEEAARIAFFSSLGSA